LKKALKDASFIVLNKDMYKVREWNLSINVRLAYLVVYSCLASKTIQSRKTSKPSSNSRLAHLWQSA
jgi:hypothetical protein